MFLKSKNQRFITDSGRFSPALTPLLSFPFWFGVRQFNQHGCSPCVPPPVCPGIFIEESSVRPVAYHCVSLYFWLHVPLSLPRPACVRGGVCVTAGLSFGLTGFCRSPPGICRFFVFFFFFLHFFEGMCCSVCTSLSEHAIRHFAGFIYRWLGCESEADGGRALCAAVARLGFDIGKQSISKHTQYTFITLMFYFLPFYCHLVAH